jgi:transcriptional regulator
VYTPAHFAGDDAAAADLIAEAPLAQLVVVGDEGLVATPVPMLVRGTSLVGHLARGNPVWRREGPALAIFTGVDAYVSPRWYEGKRTDGKVVPTWNYTTVHASGRLVAHDEPAWKLELVAQLTERFESAYDDPWSVTDAPADYVESMLRGIVGIELVDVRFECKVKLSQNRSPADQAAVTAALGFGPG